MGYLSQKRYARAAFQKTVSVGFDCFLLMDLPFGDGASERRNHKNYLYMLEICVKRKYIAYLKLFDLFYCVFNGV